MTHGHDQHRRGVALLLTLAALVLVLTVSAGIARLSANAAMREKLDAHSALADDLLMAADAPIVHWLASESAKVVLSADATSPEVAVLHDKWVVDDLQFKLQITAWDQQGMAPIHLIQRGSPLRLAVPQHALDITDRATIGDDEPLGLDMLDAIDRDDSSRIWPLPGAYDVSIIEPSGTRIERTEPGLSDTLDHVGELIATHNPRNQINVNTAPIALIEQAMRMAERGGIEQIIASRSIGEVATVPTLQVTDHQADAPQLVASSTCWSFRIDTRIGRARRSWWAVYTRADKGWTCVQRLAITR